MPDLQTLMYSPPGRVGYTFAIYRHPITQQYQWMNSDLAAQIFDMVQVFPAPYLYAWLGAADASASTMTKTVGSMEKRTNLYVNPRFNQLNGHNGRWWGGSGGSGYYAAINPAENSVSHGWNGTAGLSSSNKFINGNTSRQNLYDAPKGSTVAGGTNQTFTTGPDSSFISGSSIRSTFTATTANWNINLLRTQAVQANQWYVASFYVKTSLASTSMRVTAKTVTAGGADIAYHDGLLAAVPQGEITRLSVVFRAESNATGALLFLVPSSSTAQTNDTVAISTILLEKTQTLLPWFDGDSPATSLTPGPTDQGGPATYVRKGWTTANGPNGDTTGNNGDTGIEASPQTTGLTPGAAYTWSGWVRSSVGGKYANARALTQTPENQTVTDIPGPQALLVPNVWTRLSTTFTIPSTADRAYLILDINGNTPGPSWDAGDTLDATGGLLELGSTVNPYFDGSMVAPTA